MGFLDRIKQSLSKTKQQFVGRFDDVVRRADDAEHRSRPVDLETIEALEEALISADVGVAATERIVDAVRARRRRDESLRDLVKAEILAILRGADAAVGDGHHPHVVMIVGVNGTGKTTSIAKLAQAYREDGEKVVVAAGDTFRAAAIEQLKSWGTVVGAEVVAHKQGADPGAVVFDAMTAAESRSADVVLIDTAGRLHTKFNLMEELGKIRRIIERKVPEGPDEVMLVLDSTTGQNALVQAKAFAEVVPITALCLTKLDGTSKGGIVFAVADQLEIPVRFIGTGEKPEDLTPFDAEEFVDALFR
jgi:fused signal recognition particle receptor